MDDFYSFLKQKYPDILKPEKLVQLIFHELEQYTKINPGYRLPRIGYFSKNENLGANLRIRTKKEIKNPKIDFDYLLKNKVLINQISLYGTQQDLKEPEEEIVAEGDFELDDLF